MTALEGPLRAAVIRIAWPAALGYLLIFANNFVDYFWVKLLGTEASAGQTAGWMLFWMVGSFGQIFSVGVTAVVARRVGEGRLEAAASSAAQGMRAALLGSVLVGVAGWMLVPVFVSGNASSPAAAGYTTDYLRTIFAGTPLLFSFYVLEGTFKGHGDTRRPLRAMVCALGLNIVLDPILIHVVGLEVLGAAVTAYDPVVKGIPEMPEFKTVSDPYGAAEGADALIVVTDWPEFLDLDFTRLAMVMRGNLILDGRNMLSSALVAKAGLAYEGIGRGELGVEAGDAADQRA